MTAEELPHVKDIERFIDQKITRQKLEDFDYVFSAIFNEDSVAAALKGPRASRTHKACALEPPASAARAPRRGTCRKCNPALEIRFRSALLILLFARLAQWLERLLHTQEVAGSNPASRTTFRLSAKKWG